MYPEDPVHFKEHHVITNIDSLEDTVPSKTDHSLTNPDTYPKDPIIIKRTKHQECSVAILFTENSLTKAQKDDT
jgi:hypothetical protein